MPHFSSFCFQPDQWSWITHAQSWKWQHVTWKDRSTLWLCVTADTVSCHRGISQTSSLSQSTSKPPIYTHHGFPKQTVHTSVTDVGEKVGRRAVTGRGDSEDFNLSILSKMYNVQCYFLVFLYCSWIEIVAYVLVACVSLEILSGLSCSSRGDRRPEWRESRASTPQPGRQSVPQVQKAPQVWAERERNNFCTGHFQK